MKLDFSLLCSKINFDSCSALADISILDISNPSPHIFALSLQLTSTNEAVTLGSFLDHLQEFVSSNFNQTLETTLSFRNSVQELRFYSELFWSIVRKLTTLSFEGYVLPPNPKEFQKTYTLNFEVSSHTHLETLSDLNTIILSQFHKWGFSKLNVVFSFFQKKEEDLDLEPKVLEVDTPFFLQTASEPQFFATSSLINKISLKDFYVTQIESVVLEGEVFSIDRHQRSGSSMVSTIIKITDFTEAVVIKLVRKEDFQLPCEIGDYIIVGGEVSNNSFRASRTLFARWIQKTTNQNSAKIDSSPRPRIEFFARTTMSAMDGITSAKNYVLFAKQLGHPAVGIADINSVQSFPEFHYFAQKENIFAIFGATLSVFRGKEGLALLHTEHFDLEKRISDMEFVVLDLETTGLSPIWNEIIEFGGIRIKNGHIVEQTQFFIQHSLEKLPDHIKRLTGIRDEDFIGAYSQKEGLLKILEFCGDAVLVAHNANFDIGFLLQKCKDFRVSTLKNPIIDTLWVSRFLAPEHKRHSLEKVAQRFGVEYDVLVSHRADYDAQILAKIWQKFMFEFDKNQILTFQDLLYKCSNWTKKRPFLRDVSFIARNNVGLKELYKLISNVHTKNFTGECQLDLDSLEKSPNLLLGTSGSHSVVYELLFRGTTSAWKSELTRYDYVEVVPPRSFSHYISRGDLTLEQVKTSLKNLVLEAKKLGKIFIASAEPCYIHSHDKIVHEVYIHSKGLNGAKHRLYSYEDNPDCEYPTLNFLTTQEMKQEFSFLEDEELIQELVVENCYKLLELIEQIEVFKKGYHVPIYPKSKELLQSFLSQSLQKRYGPSPHISVTERINKELAPILEHDYDGIYWVSHLLVKKSLEEGFVVGSRGSVGSSFIAHLIGVTEVNPLPPHYLCNKCYYTDFQDRDGIFSGWDLPDQNCPECGQLLDKDGHNIPFETFLGFKRDKTPDIDLNFSGLNQAVIHQEVKKIFGENHTFRAGTISTNAQKTSYGYVKTFVESQGLKLSAPFIDYLTTKVTGVKRTTGQHPGGIIVVPSHLEIEDFTPVNFPANDPDNEWKTTHFDFAALEHNLLKFDILGHDDPTVIKMLEELTGRKVSEIPKSDAKVLSLFNSHKIMELNTKRLLGETTGAIGLPEFGSRLTRQVLQQAKVRSFGDLIAVSGLTHGTNVWRNNAEILVKDRGFSLQEVISCRDDIMLFLMRKQLEPQDAFDIMEKARRGQGISSKQQKLLEEKGVEDWYIASLKKISYLFPKAHATAYVIMAWRIAWFKLYYPLAFYATYLSTRAPVHDYDSLIKGELAVRTKLSDLRKKERSTKNKPTPKEKALIPVLEVILEMLARNITVQPISLKKSAATLWLIDDTTRSIIPPLTCIDGLGVIAADSIIRARKDGTFSSINNFSKRTGVNKTVLAKLKSYNVFEDLYEDEQLTLF